MVCIFSHPVKKQVRWPWSWYIGTKQGEHYKKEISKSIYSQICISNLLCFYLFIYLVVLGFELRAMNFQGMYSTALSTSSALFALVILELRSCILPKQACLTIFLLKLSALPGMTVMKHHA
jgi:hypothetical protein